MLASERNSTRRPPSDSADAESGLRARKKARKRQEITEVTLQLVRERGHEGVTVDEIARRSEISQPTFYNYFPSRDAILLEYCTRGWGDLLEEELKADGHVANKLERLFIAVSEFMVKDADLWYALAVSNVYNPVRDPNVLSDSFAGTRALESLIQTGQDNGELTTDFTASRLASFVEGIMYRCSIEWGAQRDVPAFSEAVRQSLAFFLRGTAPATQPPPSNDHRRQ